MRFSKPLNNNFSLIENCSPSGQLWHSSTIPLFMHKATVFAEHATIEFVVGRQINKNYDNLNAFYVFFPLNSFLLTDDCLVVCAFHNIFCVLPGRLERRREARKTDFSEAHCCFIMAVLLFILLTDAAKKKMKLSFNWHFFLYHEISGR